MCAFPSNQTASGSGNGSPGLARSVARRLTSLKVTPLNRRFPVKRELRDCGVSVATRLVLDQSSASA
jgi:hypothetical protein